jgi:hypothetical protein
MLQANMSKMQYIQLTKGGASALAVGVKDWHVKKCPKGIGRFP